MTRQGVLNTIALCALLAANKGLNAGGRRTADHFNDMMQRANAPDFSTGKMNRWLGWMQGVLESAGIITEDEAGEMSRTHRDD